MLLRMSLMIFVASRLMNTLGGVDEGSSRTAEDLVKEHLEAEKVEYISQMRRVAATFKAEQRASEARKRKLLEQIHTQVPRALARQLEKGCPAGSLRETVSHYTIHRRHWYSRKIYSQRWADERVCYRLFPEAEDWVESLCLATDGKFYVKTSVAMYDVCGRRWDNALHVLELEKCSIDLNTEILEALRRL